MAPFTDREFKPDEPVLLVRSSDGSFARLNPGGFTNNIWSTAETGGFERVDKKTFDLHVKNNGGISGVDKNYRGGPEEDPKTEEDGVVVTKPGAEEEPKTVNDGTVSTMAPSNPTLVNEDKPDKIERSIPKKSARKKEDVDDVLTVSKESGGNIAAEAEQAKQEFKK